jgi:3-methyladenine DNA glycosylase AlkD
MEDQSKQMNEEDKEVQHRTNGENFYRGGIVTWQNLYFSDQVLKPVAMEDQSGNSHPRYDNPGIHFVYAVHLSGYMKQFRFL